MELESFARDKEKVREFVRWAWPCMKNLHIYSREKQIRLKGVWPKIEKQIFSAAIDGIIDKNLLLYWDTAISEVLKINSNHPMLDYMFGAHNKQVKKLSKYNEQMLICLAKKGVFDGENVIIGSIVQKCEISPYLNLKKGDFVGIHLGIVVDVLDDKLFKLYNNNME